MNDFTIDNLTSKSVSIKKQEVNSDGKSIGKPHRATYTNDSGGRQKVKDELTQNQQNAIFAIWGDEPTITESEE